MAASAIQAAVQLEGWQGGTRGRHQLLPNHELLRALRPLHQRRRPGRAEQTGVPSAAFLPARPPVRPGNSGSFLSNSAKMQPQLHMSMASV